MNVPLDSAAKPLEWSMHLLRNQPEKAPVVVLVVAVVLAWSVLVFHNLLIGAAAALVAMGAVKEYLFPLRYRLDSRRATVHCGGVMWVEMAWGDVLAVYRIPAGLKLSPNRQPRKARLEHLRGMTLRFPRAMAGAVEEFVDSQRDSKAGL